MLGFAAKKYTSPAKAQIPALQCLDVLLRVARAGSQQLERRTAAVDPPIRQDHDVDVEHRGYRSRREVYRLAGLVLGGRVRLCCWASAWSIPRDGGLQSVSAGGS